MSLEVTDTISLNSSSLDDCCAVIADPDIPLSHKVALIASLPALYEMEPLNTSRADALVKSLPDDLVKNFLVAELPVDEAHSFQELLHAILAQLFVTVSDEVFSSAHLRSFLSSWLASYGRVMGIGNCNSKRKRDDILEVVTTIAQRVIKAPSPIPVDVTLIRVLIKLVGSCDQLPSSETLLCISDLMRLLSTTSLANMSEDQAFIDCSREVVLKLLKVPPNRMPKSTFDAVLDVVNEFTNVTDRFLSKDATMLALVAQLSTAQLRMVLEKPSEIIILKLVTACMRIIESSDDDDSHLDDINATKVSTAVQQAAEYVVDYWGQTADEDGESLSNEVELMLYRFICVFLAIGGQSIIDNLKLKKICASLLKIFRRAILDKDERVAFQLLCSLCDLPVLEKDVISLLLDYIEIGTATKSKAQRIEEVLRVMDELVSRSDWYDTSSLINSRLRANSMKCEELIFLFGLLNDENKK